MLLLLVHLVRGLLLNCCEPSCGVPVLILYRLLAQMLICPERLWLFVFSRGGTESVDWRVHTGLVNRLDALLVIWVVVLVVLLMALVRLLIELLLYIACMLLLLLNPIFRWRKGKPAILYRRCLVMKAILPFFCSITLSLRTEEIVALGGWEELLADCCRGVRLSRELSRTFYSSPR